MSSVTTLHDMLSEMGTWRDTSVYLKDELLKAVTTKNCPRLKKAVKDWTSGMYDEDPNLLIDDLIRLATYPESRKK